jgi:hypothetical protein
MSAPACTGPIEFAALVAYWMGELPPAEEAPLEEHLLGCAHCAQNLAALAAIGSAIRGAVRTGRVDAMISAPLLERMKKEGLRLCEYRIPAGGSVNCTLRADEDGVVGRMQAALAGVKRLDVVQVIEAQGEKSSQRLEDIPFDPAAGEVLHFPSAAAMRKMPPTTIRMRLIAVEESGEQALGEYTFVHTPS